MSDDISISGGGSQAVNTPEMQKAHTLLAGAAADLASLVTRVADVRGRLGAGLGVPSIDLALAMLHAARIAAGDTATGLQVAAVRYGSTEEVATVAFRDLVALQAGALGTVAGGIRRATGVDTDPFLAQVLAEEGFVATAAAAATLPLRMPQRAFDPFADPMLVGVEGRGIASVDDLVRGEQGQETLADALGTDPNAPDSTQRIAAAGAAAMRDDPGITLTATGGTLQETPRPSAFASPRDLADLGRLVPDDGDGRAQVRVTEVRGADGVRRWIVAVAGTTTFSPTDKDQVFDMKSNLQGVGGVPMDAEIATEDAMRAAGVQPDDPVLVVGHSQGALVAMRLAQSGHFAVADVVTLGGPTRPIAAPPSVRVLAVEHTDDPIPGTGGAAPDGPGPANRVLVRRTVYTEGLPTAWAGDTGLAPAHLPANYVDTLADVDRSPDPRVAAFRAGARPFLTGTAANERDYHADRGVPAAVPTAGWGERFRPPGTPLAAVAGGAAAGG